MVSKIKSRVWLGITTIIPESRNSLGAKVPCYNLVGTIQRLCAYSKAMISQGTGTFILNMQNQQQKVHSFSRTASSPPPARPRLSYQFAGRAVRGSGKSSIAFTTASRLPLPYEWRLVIFLHFETRLLKNRNWFGNTWEGRMHFLKKGKAKPTQETNHTHTHWSPHSSQCEGQDRAQGPSL